MNDTMQTFERFYLARKRYPQFFTPDSPNFKRALEIFKTGYCYPLSGRDHEGCRIVLINTKRLNMDEWSVFDGMRLSMFVLAVLVEEEETQICGIKLIYDHQDITTKHLMMPKDMMDFVELVKTVSAGRQKGSYIVNLPSIAHFLMEMVRNALTEKLKSRLFLFHSWEDLKQCKDIDVKLLPKELGGVKPEKEIMEEFEDLVEKRWDILEKTAKSANLDWSKVPMDKLKLNQCEVVGSFRKLEID
jgi:hypothetical protein